MKFEIQGGGSFELNCKRLVLVGYSGRDQNAVRTHVDELLAHGVPAPSEVPAVWDIPPDSLSQTHWIDAPRGQSSGEAEPVLIFHAGSVFVAVGSDHTDRRLERTSMMQAKQAFPKVVSRECWPLSDVRLVWDRIELRSQIEVDANWRLYQKGTLSELLPPEWYMERFRPDGDTVVFCGTTAALGGMETAGDGFQIFLCDPTTGREISWRYRIGASDARAIAPP